WVGGWGFLLPAVRGYGGTPGWLRWWGWSWRSDARLWTGPGWWGWRVGWGPAHSRPPKNPPALDRAGHARTAATPPPPVAGREWARPRVLVPLHRCRRLGWSRHSGRVWVGLAANHPRA